MAAGDELVRELDRAMSVSVSTWADRTKFAAWLRAQGFDLPHDKCQELRAEYEAFVTQLLLDCREILAACQKARIDVKHVQALLRLKTPRM